MLHPLLPVQSSMIQGSVWACLGTMSGGAGGDENLQGTVLGNRTVLWAFLGQVREKREREASMSGSRSPHLVEGTYCHFGMLYEETRKYRSALDAS